MATGALIASIVGVVVSAGIGAYAASESAAAAERQSKYNKRLAENQAQAAKNAAAVAEDTQREHDRRILAQQRALVGGAGLSTEGSALLVMIDSAKQAELDAVRVRYGGELQAGGLEDQAGLFGASAREARRAGAVGVGTTLLTGASNVAGAYARYKAPPPPYAGYQG